MAAAIVIDRKRRNVEDASDAFITIYSDQNNKSFVEKAANTKTGLLDISCVGPQ
jgi:hypothetical protein